LISEGGFNEEAIFALSGSPVFWNSLVPGDTTLFATI
jgi:hypothetical protein